jgi:DNA-binding NarL/FixJ family response regulator
VIRVLIVAPAARTRRTLESQLQVRGMEIAGSSVSVESAVADASEDEPDVVLIEPGELALDDLANSLQETGFARHTPTVLLATAPAETVSRLLSSGIRGILPAESVPQTVAVALEAAAEGLLVLDSREAGALPATRGFAGSNDSREPLTPREKEVLQLLAAGLGNKEIAARLNISDHTAKFHVASILGKLAASTRAEAVSIGMRRGLILI